MSQYSLIVADDNAEFVSSLQNYFRNDEIFQIVRCAENGLEALDACEKLCPDFLLLDIVMPELDGFGVLAELKTRDTAKQPTVVVISQLSGDGFVGKALRLGAKHYFAKPVSLSALRENLLDMVTPTAKEQRTQPTVSRWENMPFRAAPNKSMDEKIANIFLSVGIPAHIKGYQFLREAIKLAVAAPDIINSITKRLYPSIAERFETSPSKVERAIRHAIEVAWNRGKIENINSLFGINVYSKNEKPTNGEFIALIADKMLLEDTSA